MFDLNITPHKYHIVLDKAIVEREFISFIYKNHKHSYNDMAEETLSRYYDTFISLAIDAVKSLSMSVSKSFMKDDEHSYDYSARHSDMCNLLDEIDERLYNHDRIPDMYKLEFISKAEQILIDDISQSCYPFKISEKAIARVNIQKYSIEVYIE